MPFSVKTIALINLAVQAALLLGIFFAARQARKKRLIKHCRLVTIFVMVQLVIVLAIMLPALTSLAKNQSAPLFFQVELWLHHGLGLLVILIWSYVSLTVRGRIKLFGKLVVYMRVALFAWIVTFVLGVHLYLLVYVLT